MSMAQAGFARSSRGAAVQTLVDYSSLLNAETAASCECSLYSRYHPTKVQEWIN